MTNHKTVKVVDTALASIMKAEEALSVIDLRTLAIGPTRDAVKVARVDLKGVRERLVSMR